MKFSENLESNVDVSLSGGIIDFSWNIQMTDAKVYNAYEILLTVTADVSQNTECTVSITTSIQDISG